MGIKLIHTVSSDKKPHRDFFKFHTMNNYYIATLQTISINKWFGIIKA